MKSFLSGFWEDKLFPALCKPSPVSEKEILLSSSFQWFFFWAYLVSSHARVSQYVEDTSANLGSCVSVYILMV